MTSNPWGKFFWNDWENDPALKLCSLAAQGLWMRCLCICAKADPKGYLLVAGRPLSPADLATLVGKSEPEVESLMTELARNGVFSRDRTGRIYSRRMVRDEKKARTARENGKNGGNPTLRKDKGNPPSDNPTLKAEDKPHKPEARSQSSSTSSLRSDVVRTKPAKRRHSYSPAFEAFWKAYPTDHLMSKQEAAKAFEKLPEDDQQAVIQSISAFRAYCAKHPDYRPVHAVRYISQRRHEGFLTAPKPPNVEPSEPEPDGWPDRFRGRYAAMRHAFVERGHWPMSWGPEPGKYGCMLPQSIQDSWQSEKWRRSA